MEQHSKINETNLRCPFGVSVQAQNYDSIAELAGSFNMSQSDKWVVWRRFHQLYESSQVVEVQHEKLQLIQLTDSFQHLGSLLGEVTMVAINLSDVSATEGWCKVAAIALHGFQYQQLAESMND